MTQFAGKPESERKHMRWWGWGKEISPLNFDNKPKLWPYLVKSLDVPVHMKPASLPKIEEMALPDQNVNQCFVDQLKEYFKPEQILGTAYERIVHAYGKSYRDLWRMRRGLIESAPDVVVYPESEEQLSHLMALANKHNVVLVPFGGGSNIVGAVEMKQAKCIKQNQSNQEGVVRPRMAVSVDMRKMCRLLKLDPVSQTATFQAGVFGPELEEQLAKHNFTLGHFPDSFEFSTLGGWVATRSAGMQSDSYGNIEDMMVAARVVTLNGILSTQPVPRSSNGVNLNELCLGSEGVFGIISEVTVAIRPIPVAKAFYGYIFHHFEQGVEALQECAQQGKLPIVSRLNDPYKTALSFAYKDAGNWKSNLLTKLIKISLSKFKKIDWENCCLMITGYEGDSAQELKKQRKKAEKIFKKHGAVSLGTAPGKSFYKGKYDFPYIRDFLMDYDIIADVSETSTVWSNVLPLYKKTKCQISKAMIDTSSLPWVGCHISHNYRTGASLYFTFGCKANSSLGIAQYDKIKSAAETSFLENQATLSHHHAVGYEHLPWVEREISTSGLLAISALKRALDPQGILNPGKLIPEQSAEVKLDESCTI